MRFMILCTPGTVGMTAVGCIAAVSPMMETAIMKRRDIEIVRYEARYDPKAGKPVYFAIGKDGKEYEMPDAFKNGYNDDYLEIRWAKSEMPEVFDLPEEGYWIPIRTAPLTKVKS